MIITGVEFAKKSYNCIKAECVCVCVCACNNCLGCLSSEKSEDILTTNDINICILRINGRNRLEIEGWRARTSFAFGERDFQTKDRQAEDTHTDTHT